MLRACNERGVPTDSDLSLAWSNAVESGQAAYEFHAAHDDLQGRWKREDKILLGVTRSGRGFCYYAKNLSTGRNIDAAIEEKEIPGTEFRCHFNGYRALRPGGRVSNVGRQPDIPPGPAECRFSCQDPKNTLSLLRRVPLAQVRLKNFLWGAYYNVAPLEAEGHFIWVPIQMSDGRLILPHYSQTLGRTIVEDLFLLRGVDSKFILLFNSPHAGASVNHLHVNAVYRRRPFPIEKQRATSCGRFHILSEYPAEVFMFRGDQSVAAVSDCAAKLQELGIPFNLMWIGARAFLAPRNIAHEVTEEFPFDAISAMDICGNLVTTDKATYDSASKERIETALRKSTIDAGKFLQDW